MIRVIIFLVAFFMCFAARAADAEVYIFDRNIKLPGPCVYFVRNVTEASFECNPEDKFETAYSLHVMTSKESGSTKKYIENCLDKSCETDTQKLLGYRKQQFGKEEHYYFAMMLKAHNGTPETTAYKYTICGSDPLKNNSCMELNSLSSKYIKQVIRKASDEQIKFDL